MLVLRLKRLAFIPKWERIELTVSCEEGNSSTSATCSSGSAYAMNVILGVVGIVIVQHMSDISYILNERLASLPNVSYDQGPYVVV